MCVCVRARVILHAGKATEQKERLLGRLLVYAAVLQALGTERWLQFWQVEATSFECNLKAL